MEKEKEGLVEPDDNKAYKLFKKELQDLKNEIEEENTTINAKSLNSSSDIHKHSDTNLIKELDEKYDKKVEE